jgi:hypothetical protein
VSCLPICTWAAIQGRWRGMKYQPNMLLYHNSAVPDPERHEWESYESNIADCNHLLMGLFIDNFLF